MEDLGLRHQGVTHLSPLVMAQVRDKAGEMVKPGVTTDEIDIAVHNVRDALQHAG